jgi:hypothetical protein
MLTRARVSVGTKERGMEWKSRRAGLAASTAHKKTPPTDDTRARHPPRSLATSSSPLVDSPCVSRQLAVPGDETLDDLHHLLRRAFGWDGVAGMPNEDGPSRRPTA